MRPSPADGGLDGAQPLQDAVRVTWLQGGGQEGGAAQTCQRAPADLRSVFGPGVARQEGLQGGSAPWREELSCGTPACTDRWGSAYLGGATAGSRPSSEAASADLPGACGGPAPRGPCCRHADLQTPLGQRRRPSVASPGRHRKQETALLAEVRLSLQPTNQTIVMMSSFPPNLLLVPWLNLDGLPSTPSSS